MAEPKRFLLRLDPRLFEALRRWAKDDLRSINAQIEYLLTQQARRAGRLSDQRQKPSRPEPPAIDEDSIKPEAKLPTGPLPREATRTRSGTETV